MSDFPKVTISPVECDGLPVIKGYQTDVVAELFLHSRVIPYGLSRAELIVACWYEAQWGRRDLFTDRWRLWAMYVQAELRRGDIAVDDLPLPPKLMATEPGE